MLAPNIKENLINCIQLSYQTDSETKDKFLQLLSTGRQALGKYSNTHFTSSAFVVDNTLTKALLMNHRKYEKWLPFGGHWIEDVAIQETLLQSAAREMFEEGFDNKPIQYRTLYQDMPIDLDIHEAKDHVHYDFGFLLQISESEKPTLSNESKEIVWIDLKEIALDANHIYPDRIVRMAQKTLELTQKPIKKTKP